MFKYSILITRLEEMLRMNKSYFNLFVSGSKFMLVEIIYIVVKNSSTLLFFTLEPAFIEEYY